MARAWSGRLAVALVAALVLAGCGTDDDGTKSAVTKITMWIQTGGWTDIDKEFVKKFNERNTSVQIDYVSMPGDTIVENLLLALRTGRGPDMWFGPSPDEVVPQGYAGEVGPLLDEASKKAYQPYLQGHYDFIYDGKVMALPSATVTVRLMYNKDLFTAAGLDPNRPPKTYSEVKQAADAITKAGNGKAYGYALPLAFDGFMPNFIEPGITGGNPDLTNFGAFNMKTGAFDMKSYQPAIQLFRDLIGAKSMFPGAGTLNRDGMRAAFSNGQIGMYVGNSLELGAMNNQLKTKVNWGAAPVPVPDGQTLVNGTAFTGSNVFVNSKTKDKTALAQVYNAWMGPERIGPLRKGGIIFPTSLTARGDAAFTPSDIRGYRDFEPSGIDKQPAPSPGTLVTVSGAPYSQVVASLILNKADPAGPLTDASNRYTAAYQAAVKDGKLKAGDFQP